MSKNNPLLGLVSSYGDSDEDSEDEVPSNTSRSTLSVSSGQTMPSIEIPTANAGIHPAPIPHCPWSACYDESSGCTYYWNQVTNAVTWDAPPEYLLALKLAQQQLHSSGSAEVSAEEWQLYQQALAEKQNTQKKIIPKPAAGKSIQAKEKMIGNKQNNTKTVKRKSSSDEEIIELITSYYNSDSESNDESETPVKPVAAPSPSVKPKNPHKKQKTKVQAMEYGPSLPTNQNYVMPIGPELPPNLIIGDKSKSPENKIATVLESNEDIKPTANDTEDIQDDDVLLKKLKDKAKLLEKLGGEIPSELQKIIEEESSRTVSPVKSVEENSVESKVTADGNIDDLLEEIEKKEFAKIVKSKEKIDMFDDEDTKKRSKGTAPNSPKSTGCRTPPLEELKVLFPSSKSIEENKPKALFPSAANVQENGVESELKPATPPLEEVNEKKGANLYMMDVNEPIENVSKKKRRIDNTVLPLRKTSDIPSYTTKYSQFIEGFSSERTGLGFSKENTGNDSPKKTINYGNGLTFMKGETLNEEKKDESLDDLTDVVEAKLKFLCQQQPSTITPVQEMLIQMQTLGSAFRAGSLSVSYWRRWTEAANASLSQHEAIAAPPGWTCTFHRSEGRYRYVRESDGLMQWEYPAVGNTDMDICTTPPPPPEQEPKQEDPPAPPLPPLPPAPLNTPLPPPPPAWSRTSTPPPPPPPAWAEAPPPPAWADPPPPGCDEQPQTPPQEQKKEIGDELLSFYNDIAELEKQTSTPQSAPESPERLPEKTTNIAEVKKIKVEDKSIKKKEIIFKDDKDNSQIKEKEVKNKKKSKVKISSSIGMKQKTVTSLVAKWQQVADEINSD